MGLVLGEDHRDRLIDALEGRGDESPVGGWSLVEGYVEHGLEVHVHVTLLISEPGAAKAHRAKVCTVFKWPDDAALNQLYAELGISAEVLVALRRKLVNAAKGCEKVKRAVLVPVPEFIEYRKRVPFRVLPAVERLQSPEACLETWRLDLAETAFAFPRPVGSIEDNRKTDAFPGVAPWDRIWRRRPGVHDAESVDEVVKGGSEVMDDLTDQDRPFRFRRFSKDNETEFSRVSAHDRADLHDLPIPRFEPRIVEDGSIGIRLRGEKDPDLLIEYLDVLPRPTHLLDAPSETAFPLGGWHWRGEDA